MIMLLRRIRGWLVGVCSFLGIVANCLQAADKAWDGGAGSWTDSHWSGGGGAPQAGDVVTIGSGTVVLDGATAWLESLTLTNGTLVMTNWSSTVQATNVIVCAGGVLTCAGPFVDAGPSNRVNVICTNFTLFAGGSVTVNGKGYAAQNGPGKGATNGGRGGGAGYGGVGGVSVNNTAAGGPVYGSTNTPTAPGSGGGNTGGGAGGGAIRIVAGGLCLVSGTMDADGNPGTDLGSGEDNNGGGSGGAIYITCNTFIGTSGVLRACGGSTGTSPGGSYGGKGGGGRLAVDYQTLGACTGMVFTTAPGSAGQGTPDYGTLYLGGAGFLSATMDQPVFQFVKLFIPGLAEWRVSSLTVTNCHLDLGYNGTTITVTNDVRVLAGSIFRADRLMAGGHTWIQGCTAALWRAVGTASNLTLNGGACVVGSQNHTNFSELSCGGDVLLTNTAALRIYSRATNGLSTSYGALVSVTGNLTIATGSGGSWYFPYSHNTDGGSPLLRASNLTIAASSGVNARNLGYAATYGPGVPANNERGPGHGGRGGGGRGGNPGGSPYGQTNAPTAPGSGGGPGGEAGAGGGLIRLEIGGTLNIDGSLDASPNTNVKSPGSGGAIFVTCAGLGGSGQILANGRNSQYTDVVNGSGGGRIAIWYGNAVQPHLSSIVSNLPVPNMVWATNYPGLTATASCGSGTRPEDQPEPGTVRFLTIQQMPAISNTPPTQVTRTSADLNGFLVTTGAAATVAGVFWGTADGGTNKAAWANTNMFPGAQSSASPLSTNVTLAPGYNYYYAYYVSNANGEAWASPSEYLISDDVTLQALQTEAYEQGTVPATVLVSRASALTHRALTVSLTIAGTATNGSDYTEITNRVTLAAGQSNAVMVIAPTFNADPEPDRSVSLTVSNGAYAVGAGSNVIVTIVDSTPVAGTNTTVAAGDWSGSSTWSLSRPPIDGDRVIVTSNISLSVTSALLQACVIDRGTLSFANWGSCLRAVDVIVLSGGVLTCAGPFVDAGASNRVNVTCTNFTLLAGGNVTVAGKGYAAQNGPGKGATNSGRGGGGGYGGVGGMSVNSTAAGGPVYGSTNAPTAPGSGGGNTGGGAGGGAIRIVADGVCLVNGTMDADGNPGTDLGSGEDNNGGGSGGAIYITCNTFIGTNGVLRARGGSTGTSPGGSYGGKGGGGRLAVDYQTLGACTGLVFTTAPGSAGQGTPDYGTLYLGGAGFLSATMDQPMFQFVKLFIPGLADWRVSSLTVTNCHLDLGYNGTTVTVTNDLRLQAGSIFGADRLIAGGHTLIQGCTATLFQAVGLASNITLNGAALMLGSLNHTNFVELTCGGDLLLTNAATLRLYSRATNGLSTSYGALVSVTGTVTIAGGAGNSWVYPYSHTSDGGSPLLRASAMTITTNSGINANDLGYGVVQGPGKPATWEQGAGHGGRGGGGSGGLHGGVTYGSTNAPLGPGSGGGSGGENGPGGGSIRLEISGPLVLDGKLLANATVNQKSPGSGGAVFVTCAQLTGTGQIATDGRNSNHPELVNGSGGGRIAVWYGNEVPSRIGQIAAGLIDDRHILWTTNYPGLTATAACGSGTHPTGDQAEPGTIRFIRLAPPTGSSFVIR